MGKTGRGGKDEVQSVGRVGFGRSEWRGTCFIDKRS